MLSDGGSICSKFASFPVSSTPKSFVPGKSRERSIKLWSWMDSTRNTRNGTSKCLAFFETIQAETWMFLGHVRTNMSLKVQLESILFMGDIFCQKSSFYRWGYFRGTNIASEMSVASFRVEVLESIVAFRQVEFLQEWLNQWSLTSRFIFKILHSVVWGNKQCN